MKVSCFKYRAVLRKLFIFNVFNVIERAIHKKGLGVVVSAVCVRRGIDNEYYLLYGKNFQDNTKTLGIHIKRPFHD